MVLVLLLCIISIAGGILRELPLSTVILVTDNPEDAEVLKLKILQLDPTSKVKIRYLNKKEPKYVEK